MREFVGSRVLVRWIGVAVLSASLGQGMVWGQPEEGQPAAGATGGLQVVIERAPLMLRPPSTYDIPLKLQPGREVTLVAMADGVVVSVMAKPGGQKVLSGSEIVRIDARIRQLELERAKAALAVAVEEEKGAAGSVTKARVAVAEKDVEIAELNLELTSVRVPFEGHLYSLPVVEGAYVRRGDPLATITDATRLVAEVPIDRNAFKVGDMIELKVEETTVQGKLTAIVPLSPRFDPLRGLFQSVAGGIVEIDNAGDRFLTGQTVYSPMIPRNTVTEVGMTVIRSTEDGTRTVQVIRDGFVRNVPVVLLGQIGDGNVWVTGRFSPGDELVVRSSEPLLDGARVVHKNAGPATPSTGRTPATTPRSNDF
ncbi:MAG: HlyD family efflux transporter periplasmic adaptor subunit [Planctomycetaceae bacterium]